MNSFFYICLFVLGTIFGSFASVIIYRLKSGEKGIGTGRSHCNKCGHMLHFWDLVPIFSYISTLGKCRYCKDKVSIIYPILEIVSGLLYALIGYFLIDFSLILFGDILEITKLLFFLIVGFLSIVYTFYDILFLEIHEKVLLTGVVLSFTALSIQTVFPSFQVIPFLPVMTESISIGIYAIILSIIIVSLLYAVMLKGLKEIYDILLIIGTVFSLVLFKYFFNVELSDIPILSGVIGALGLFIFFFLQILVSGGAWMGGGDLRIAIFIGLILGIPFTFAGAMITYLVGSILGIGLIIYSRINKLKKGTKMDSQIPFGPFLAMGFFITIFFQEDIGSFIEIYFRGL